MNNKTLLLFVIMSLLNVSLFAMSRSKTFYVKHGEKSYPILHALPKAGLVSGKVEASSSGEIDKEYEKQLWEGFCELYCAASDRVDLTLLEQAIAQRHGRKLEYHPVPLPEDYEPPVFACYYLTLTPEQNWSVDVAQLTEDQIIELRTHFGDDEKYVGDVIEFIRSAFGPSISHDQRCRFVHLSILERAVKEAVARGQ